MPRKVDPFKAKKTLKSAQGSVIYYDLQQMEKLGIAKLTPLPFSIRVLLENALRNYDGNIVTEDDVLMAAHWDPKKLPDVEFPFMPSRVLLQDFTGVPAVVDLASMRAAMERMGGDPARINPQVPADLVIDHSVQVDYFGPAQAFRLNVEKEFERNKERYALLRWAQRAFKNFRVVPPGTGIVHQVNLEYLARVIDVRKGNDGTVAFPDTLVGTDSHTTMVNGLSVVGFGVGGIEAEAVLLNQPYYMLLPEVVGFKFVGQLKEGATATDLVLRVTEMLRKKGVVGKFVEYYGTGLSNLPLPDRATIANMAPEYGATVGFFPLDNETLVYLKGTGRPAASVDLVEKYAKAQGIFRTDDTPDPQYSDTLELNLADVEPSLAGPRRPQDRVTLKEMKKSFATALTKVYGKTSSSKVDVKFNGHSEAIDHGAVVIAAITSCTNTSNPSVMIGAGLLAKKAVEKGLKAKPWVKTSLAPGSRVVMDYLDNADLTRYLNQLGFNVVGFGCTTCIGNSGPLPEPVAAAVSKGDVVAAAVLSGNRNFEGRIHPLVKANYLASPVLVVAYALAGTMELDLSSEPLGSDRSGKPVYLKDIWPSQKEIRDATAKAVKPEIFEKRYSEVFEGDSQWRSLPIPEGDLFEWDSVSTYVRKLTLFEDMPTEPQSLVDIKGARVLAVLGDSITTDHISPAGDIDKGSPAGRYLIEHGVQPLDFNTYGSRRGNHEVMIRGTFANIRLRNTLVPGTEGWWTAHIPSGQKMTIFEASERYAKEGTPLVVLGGKEYGSGSSRDWAAKGTMLLGIRAVIAESFERIHRSNLVGMGVLPIQFKPGQNRESLGLTGQETFDIEGITDLKPHKELSVRAKRKDGPEINFQAIARIDTPIDVEYYRHKGVLQFVLRRILKEG